MGKLKWSRNKKTFPEELRQHQILKALVTNRTQTQTMEFFFYYFRRTPGEEQEF
jgi:hypothetical protein